MLKFVAPDWKAQESVAIFTKPGCQFCAKVKQALQDKGLSYEEIVLGKDATVTSVRAITGKMTALKSSSAANTSAAAKIWKLTWLKTDSCLLKAV